MNVRTKRANKKDLYQSICNILILIFKTPGLTSQEIASSVGLTNTTTFGRLMKLYYDHLIRRFRVYEETKKGRYRVIYMLTEKGIDHIMWNGKKWSCCLKDIYEY